MKAQVFSTGETIDWRYLCVLLVDDPDSALARHRQLVFDGEERVVTIYPFLEMENHVTLDPFALLAEAPQEVSLCAEALLAMMHTEAGQKKLYRELTFSRYDARKTLLFELASEFKDQASSLLTALRAQLAAALRIHQVDATSWRPNTSEG